METMEEEANEADQNLADSNRRTMAERASTTIKSKFMINDILDGEDDEEENEVETKAAEEAVEQTSAAATSSTFLPAMTALALANFHNQNHHHQHHLYSRPSVGFLPTFHHQIHSNRKTSEDSCSAIGVTKEDHCDSSLHEDPSPSSGIYTFCIILNHI